MRCAAINCKENTDGYCGCDSYVTIDSEGKCESFYPLTNKNSSLSTPRQSKTNTPYTCDLSSIIFERMENAAEVLNSVKRIIDWYGIALVSDLYHVLELPCRPLDNAYGWVSLDTAEIIEVDCGYSLKLPDPYPIYD